MVAGGRGTGCFFCCTRLPPTPPLKRAHHGVFYVLQRVTPRFDKVEAGQVVKGDVWRKQGRDLSADVAWVR